jgi:hypothetical protein
MSKIQITLVVLIVVAGVTATILIRQRTQVKLAENSALIDEVATQINTVRQEQQRLSQQLANPNPSSSGNPTNELSKLRQEADALKAQAQRAKERQAQRGAPAASQKPAPEPVRSPEYYQQLHERAGGKDKDALALGLALRMYTADHNGQFPAKADALTPYLQKEGISLSGTNDFDVVFHGSLDALSKVPASAVALLRDRQTWLAPSGKQARVYGMADGSGRVVESDDDFKSWEAEHVQQEPNRQ